MWGVQKFRVPLLLLILICGCLPRASIPLSPEQRLAHRAIIRQIQERSDRIHSLSGAARLVIRTPEGPYIADEIIRLRIPGDLRLETRDPMGRLQILLITSGEQGVVLYPGTSKEIRFPTTRNSLKRYLGLDLSAGELFGIFSGTPPLPPLEPDQIRVLKDKEKTLMKILHQGRVSQQIWLDRTGCILRWERLDPGEEPRETILFNDFRDVAGIAIPFEIRFQASDHTEFVLRYRSLFLNQKIEDRLFEIPKAGEVLKP